MGRVVLVPQRGRLHMDLRFGAVLLPLARLRLPLDRATGLPGRLVDFRVPEVVHSLRALRSVFLPVRHFPLLFLGLP